MSEEKVKVYHVKTNDGTLHTIEALYAFNNCDKGGSLIFRGVEVDGRKPTVAEFAIGGWQWYRLKPTDTEPSGYKEDRETLADRFDYTAAQDYRP